MRGFNNNNASRLFCGGRCFLCHRDRNKPAFWCKVSL